MPRGRAEAPGVPVGAVASHPCPALFLGVHREAAWGCWGGGSGGTPGGQGRCPAGPGALRAMGRWSRGPRRWGSPREPQSGVPASSGPYKGCSPFPSTILNSPFPLWGDTGVPVGQAQTHSPPWAGFGACGMPIPWGTSAWVTQGSVWFLGIAPRAREGHTLHSVLHQPSASSGGKKPTLGPQKTLWGSPRRFPLPLGHPLNSSG